MRNIYFYSVIIIFVGFIFAYWYGRKTKEWKWSEYFFMATAPFAGMILLTYFEGIEILIFFLLSSFIGFIAEYTLGLLCEKTLGRRLWVYKKLNLGGHTSLLSLPFWGGAGIIFLSLVKILNL